MCRQCTQGLEPCQATLVGDEGTGAGVRGISGGERKRVTVGVGLVTQPAVLLLDEPTSGLDSETAVAIIELMQRLAREVRARCRPFHSHVVHGGTFTVSYNGWVPLHGPLSMGHPGLSAWQLTGAVHASGRLFGIQAF